jgi:hypothetical protein
LQLAISKPTASSDMGSFTALIMNVNAGMRTGLRFRYDPELEAGSNPHPQSFARRGTVMTDGTCCPFCFMWLEE